MTSALGKDKAEVEASWDLRESLLGGGDSDKGAKAEGVAVGLDKGGQGHSPKQVSDWRRGCAK